MTLTIEQIQERINHQSLDARQLVNLIADYLQANPTSAGGTSYLVYTALLNQYNLNAPVPTVFKNTLGGVVVWTRVSIGTYRGTLANAFTTNKTFISISVDYFNSNAFTAIAGYEIAGSNIVYQVSDINHLLTDSGNVYIEIRAYS